jgi:hypothetical protein
VPCQGKIGNLLDLISQVGRGAMEAMVMEEGLRFIPTRVEGLPEVTEAAVFPDRLELCSAGKWVCFRFVEMVEWPHPAWLWRLLARFGWRRRSMLVGERDWFHPPSGRFFRFFTSPRIVVYMPDEAAETNYGSTWFRRVQDVMERGGFTTWDLG